MFMLLLLLLRRRGEDDGWWWSWVVKEDEDSTDTAFVLPILSSFDIVAGITIGEGPRRSTFKLVYSDSCWCWDRDFLSLFDWGPANKCTRAILSAVRPCYSEQFPCSCTNSSSATTCLWPTSVAWRARGLERRLGLLEGKRCKKESFPPKKLHPSTANFSDWSLLLIGSVSFLPLAVASLELPTSFRIFICNNTPWSFKSRIHCNFYVPSCIHGNSMSGYKSCWLMLAYNDVSWWKVEDFLHPQW